MSKTQFSLIIGFLCILVGVFISTNQLIGLFRPSGFVISPQLDLGAVLFKAVLVLSGAYIILLRYLPGSSGSSSETSLSQATSMKSAYFILAGFVVIALILRLYNLGVGIWFDEMLTHVNYMSMTLGEIVSTYDDANNHLLFTILARISLFIFGDSVWAFRLPAVLFGVGSILALYSFSKRVGTTKESLFAVALFTFSYHHIWFSQNARGYTALLFFTILSSTFLLVALQQNSPRKWLLYASAAFLGAYTHLTMGFVVVAHFVIYIFHLYKKTESRGNEKWIGLIYGFIPVGLVTLQAYALILPSMFGGGVLASGMQSEEMAWTNPIWALMEIVKGMQVGFANGGVALIAFFIFSIGVIDFVRKKAEVIGLLFIPTILGFSIMISIGYTLFPRFFFFAMGFGVIVVIRGSMVTGNYIGKILKLPQSKAHLPGILLCIAIVLAALSSTRYVFYPKQDFVGAMKLIEKEKAISDSIITLGIADFPFNKFYKKNWVNVKTIKELESARMSEKRTWLIYIMPVHAEAAYPKIMKQVRKDYTVVKQFYGTLNGGDVVVCLENQKVLP